MKKRRLTKGEEWEGGEQKSERKKRPLRCGVERQKPRPSSWRSGRIAAPDEGEAGRESRFTAEGHAAAREG